MTSDSKHLFDYQCPKCGSDVKVIKTLMLAGPQKGQEVVIDICISCEDKALAQEAWDQRETAKKNMIVKLFDDNSLMSDRLKHVSFDNYNPTDPSQKKAFTATLDYTNEFNRYKPNNLLISGSYGVGKSHLAASIVKELMKKDYSCIFISVPKLFTKIQSTFNSKSDYTVGQLLSCLEAVDCLVLDDIGAEHSKTSQDENEHNWMLQKLFEIVDSRSGKHTIYTSNLNAHNLSKKVKPRIFSRMMENTETLFIEGKDHRLQDFGKDGKGERD